MSRYNFGISVIVCTYNRYSDLNKFIQSYLAQQKITIPHELIVVDNNSSDRTSELALWNPSEIEFKYAFEPNQGLSSARNKGAEVATYSWLMYCDDDSFLPDDFLLNLVDTISNNDVDLYGGACLPYYPDGLPSWFPAELETRLKSRTITASHSITLSGSNFGIKRELLFEIGGFNKNFGMVGHKQGMLEERILIETYRNSINAKPILYNPKLFVYHKTPKSRFSVKFQLNRVFLSETAIVRYFVLNGARITFPLIVNAFIDALSATKKSLIKIKLDSFFADCYRLLVVGGGKLSFIYAVYSSYKKKLEYNASNKGKVLAIISDKIVSESCLKKKAHYGIVYSNEEIEYIFSWGMTRDALAQLIRTQNLKSVKIIAFDSDKYSRQARSIRLHNLNLCINLHTRSIDPSKKIRSALNHIKNCLTYDKTIKL